MKTKKLILIALSLALLSACGPRLQVEGFESYIATFEEASIAAGKPVKITNLSISLIDELNPGTVGLCSGGSIYLLKSYWESADDDMKEILLMHEMGHCVLGRGHTDENETIYVPSLMHAKLCNEVYYRDFKDMLKNELFNEAK